VLPRVLPSSGTSQVQLPAERAHQTRLLSGNDSNDRQIHDNKPARELTTL
jgi:hypothetical protein